ncbi:MAG: hypothetical protein D6689_09605 [Deltaproteobacteria bacterium]|nr:MAG: hypothetical protein D6689_09605 [Deltaproteobacteria bacterium]
MPIELNIRWEDLEAAVERNAPDTESFLDLETGDVVTIVGGEPEAPVLKRRVAEHIDKYRRIDPASSREQYRWMERFVASVADDGLRQRLRIAIDGKGAFRRFKDVLAAYPAERERWFSYRSDLLHWHMHTWLSSQNIAPSNPPPWGPAKPPPELPQVAPAEHPVAAEPPGEALRREAKELIDALAAIELPSAIAFLEFLKQRGTRALTGTHRADTDDGGNVEVLRSAKR